ncbi:hypothetical protein D7B24_006061 [Verticillium nonalfalfae]|nr:uncharacterized protein D7B24_006061 [Verticillium nonalfalfae]RNJ57448.1 hypothetical protein D7B24_006061 [Verticillium nonalfalfae]
MNEREADSDTTPPRKRIAVACTRCRKRKIRCSGDPGDGLPCHNCKNAGAEPCQFLRVASQETTIIQTDRGFAYDIDTARAYQVRGIIPSAFPPQYPPDLQDGLTRFPSPSASYNSTARYQGIPSWTSAYCDETADFSNMGYHPSYYSQDPAYLYRMASATERTEPSSLLYGDVGANYNYGQRPVASGDSPNFSLSSVAASLPSSNDSRLLPTPVNRTLASSGASIYRADETSPYSYKAQNGTATLSSPVVSLSEDSGGYLSCESSPAPAYQASSGPPSASGSASSTSSASNRMSMSMCCGTDGYSTSSSIFSNSELRAPGSGSDSSYDYGDTLRRSSGTPLLSNGQPYKVPQQPTPSMPSHRSGTHSHHDHHSALSAAAYLLSGLSDPGTAGGPGTDISGATAVGGGGNVGSGSSAMGHADVQTRVPVGSLPAA